MMGIKIYNQQEYAYSIYVLFFAVTVGLPEGTSPFCYVPRLSLPAQTASLIQAFRTFKDDLVAVRAMLLAALAFPVVLKYK